MSGLAESDRWQLLALLGLTSFPFRYEERLGSQVVRSWICSENGVEVLFPNSSPPVSPLPTLVRAHSLPALSEEVLFKPQSLWSECMPFPFSAWAQPYGAEASGEVSSDNSEWWAAAQQLRASFQTLEDKVFSCEVTHLHIENSVEAPPFSLFFHCVRRKYLQIRKIDALETGSPNETPVASRYQSLHLSVSHNEGFVSQIESLGSAVRKCVDADTQPIANRGNLSPEALLPL
jgi:hypothetical protein